MEARGKATNGRKGSEEGCGHASSAKVVPPDMETAQYEAK